MTSQGELGAVLAGRVREKIRKAANEVSEGSGDLVERLVAAWPLLRPLFPNTVPGQAGLSVTQKLELQSILTTLAGTRGAGASSPDIRRLQRWEAVKVVDRLRRLDAALSVGSVPSDGPLLVAGTPPRLR